jgi:hypothetical protein
MANKAPADLEERVRKLENKFNIAVTIAVFLGISIAGLGTWVQTEEKKVSALHEQVAAMTPTVAAAQDAIRRTSEEQIKLVRSQAEPVIRQIAQENFAESNHRVDDEIKDLQTESFFILYAQIVYPCGGSGKYHDMLDSRKNWFVTHYNRPKEEIQGVLAQQGFPPN